MLRAFSFKVAEDGFDSFFLFLRSVRLSFSSQGHNHSWILDDVTNMDVVVGHLGNSLITLFEP